MDNEESQVDGLSERPNIPEHVSTPPDSFFDFSPIKDIMPNSLAGTFNFDDEKKKKWTLVLLESSKTVLTAAIVLVAFVLILPWYNYFAHSSQSVKDKIATNQSDAIFQAKDDPTPRFYFKNNDVTIQAPIVEGISAEDLSKGIGHHPESVWPDQKGNVVLAGHNFDLDPANEYGQIFLNLRDIKIGDSVFINYKSQRYTYEVQKRETISPNDLTLLKNTDDWQLTFYTCDPPYTNLRRLVYQARLISID